MVISAECMVTQTNACLATNLSMCAIAQLVGVNCNLNLMPYAVACTALLPSAALNTGRFIYVTNIGSYRFSDGVSWSKNYTGTIPIANLLSWGADGNGQLGDGANSNQSSPVVPSGAYDRSWCQVSAGSSPHTAAVKTNGTAWTWGCNGFGRLGDGSVINRCSPGTLAGGGTTWCQISAGTQHAAAIKTDGTAWTWGYNKCGRLGDGTVVGRSSPGTVSGGGTTWCSINAANYHTGAVQTNGTAWTWGLNSSGELGDGTVIGRSSPGTLAGAGTTWCSISTGSFQTAAVKTDGTAWTWGSNYSGTLGDGTVTNRSSPGTLAGGGTTWRAVSTGNAHTVAVKTDGTAWTWGRNNSGQLGNGTTTSRSSPGTTAGGGTTWCQISAGYQSSAVKTDGTAWSWGYNGSGGLGDGTKSNRSSPIIVLGNLTTWCSISAGQGHTAGILVP